MILPFAYTIIRSKRKSIQIRVNAQGQVEVRGGRRLTKAQAEQILYQHQDWIQTQIARQTARAAQRHILTADEIANLTEQAERDLPVRTAHWASRMGVQPTGVRITAAATRWGSCSAKNRICYSFRVMLLPEALRDYIVVHELSHIRQKNHSADFYAEGTRYLFCRASEGAACMGACAPAGVRHKKSAPKEERCALCNGKRGIPKRAAHPCSPCYFKLFNCALLFRFSAAPRSLAYLPGSLSKTFHRRVVCRSHTHQYAHRNAPRERRFRRLFGLVGTGEPRGTELLFNF